jgi:hypothetical protein
MNIVFALILVAANIYCFIYFRPIAHTCAKFMAKRFREHYGEYATERGWDDPKTKFNKLFYQGVALFMGFWLLVVAFHELFGTIHLNQ